MTNPKRGMYRITPEQLGQLLNLPQDWRVTGMSIDLASDCLLLRFDGEGLFETPSGCPAPEVLPMRRTAPAFVLDWSELGNG